MITVGDRVYIGPPEAGVIGVVKDTNFLGIAYLVDYEKPVYPHHSEVFIDPKQLTLVSEDM